MTGPLSPNYYSAGQEREREESQLVYAAEEKRVGERVKQKRSDFEKEREKICASFNHVILLLIGLKFHCRHELN